MEVSAVVSPVERSGVEFCGSLAGAILDVLLDILYLPAVLSCVPCIDKRYRTMHHEGCNALLWSTGFGGDRLSVGGGGI